MLELDGKVQDLLRRVAEGEFHAIDLRYDAGRDLADLAHLVQQGLVACTDGGAPYLESYALTDAGKNAISIRMN